MSLRFSLLFPGLSVIGISAAIQAASFQEIRLGPGENYITTAVLDEEQDAAYFAAAESDFRYSLETSSATLLQIRLSDFSLRRRLVLGAGKSPLRGAVIDSRRRLAYFGVYGDPNRDVPGQIIQVGFDPLEEKKTFVLPKGEFGVSSAVLNPLGDVGCFGTLFGTVISVALPEMKLAGLLGLQGEANAFQCAVLDPPGSFAYFGTAGGNIMKIRLADLTPVGNVTALRTEAGFRSAFVDSASNEAYFGTQGTPGRLVRLSLANFKPEATFSLEAGQNDIVAGFCPRGEGIAYLVCAGPPAQLLKIRLKPFKILSSIALDEKIGSVSGAVFDVRRRTAYLAGGSDPARIIRIPLASLEDKPGNP